MHHRYHLLIHLYPTTPSHRPSASLPSTSSSSSFASTTTRTAARRHTPTFTPHSLFQPLPAHKPAPADQDSALTFGHDRHNRSHQQDFQDYRFGPLRIDWVDLPKRTMPAPETHASEKEKERDGNKAEEKQGRAKSSSSSRARDTGPATALFVPSTRVNPGPSGSTNLPYGVVHIFRESPPAAALTHIGAPVADGQPPMRGADAAEAAADTANADADDGEGIMLAVLAVPAWMTPSDFLGFIAPAAQGMSHLRMIRDSAPNRSIVVIKFPKFADAHEFAEAYNGRQFTSMESEICHVVRVVSVEIEATDTVSQTISRLSSSTHAAQQSHSPGGSLYELPTCPVCLERMDCAVTGLITVPCSHTFHCMCLSKWGDSRCPVCRYSQTFLSSGRLSSSFSGALSAHRNTSIGGGPALSTCASCASTTNLWICLICGNIGCGRYGRAHAHAHYTSTTHLYALELETQRVWDYAGDGYVHRLIQNKADGKLVELPPSAMAGSAAAASGGGGGGLGPSDADRLNAEKMEAVGLEYSYLLTSQLESQREHYEGMTGALQRRVEELTGLLAHAERERARAGERERARAERLASTVRRLERELDEERTVGRGLMRNLEAARARMGEVERGKGDMEERVGELEEQVRDLMVFVEARERIEVEARKAVAAASVAGVEGGGGEGAEEVGVLAEAVGGSLELRPKNGRKRRGKKG